MADNFLTDQQFDKLVSGLSAAFSAAMSGAPASTDGTPIEKKLEIDEKRRQIIQDQLKSLTDIKDIQQQIDDEADRRAQDRIDFSEKELDEREKIAIIREEELATQKEYYKVAKDTEGVEEEILNLIRERTKAALKAVNDIRAAEKKKREEDRKREKEEREHLYQIRFQADQILTRFAGIDSLTLKNAKTMKELGGAGKFFSSTLKEAANKINEVGLGALMGVKAFEKLKQAASFTAKMTLEGVGDAFDLEGNIQKAVKRQDEFRLAAREINVLTGKEIEELGEKFMNLGRTTDGTTEDFIKINKTLFNTSNIFRQLKADGDKTRETLERTAFTLERRFMINVGDTGKVLNILAQSFGKSVPQVEEFQKTLAATASTLGLDVKTVFSEFSASAANLARFGLPDIQSEFLSLSVVAQKTGLSIDQMTGALERFSTFEGALTAASKLNAVFGTTIDGMEIMEEFNLNGPVAALIKLREGLERTGRSFNDLNFSEMRVFQESLGLNSLQMQAFGNISVEELRKIQQETKGLSFAEAEKVLEKGRKEAELSAEKRLNLQDKSISAMDQMGKMMDNANRKIVDGLSSMSEGMNQLVQGLSYVGDLIKMLLIGGMIKFIGKIALATSATQSLAMANAAAQYGVPGGLIGPALPGATGAAGAGGLVSAGGLAAAGGAVLGGLAIGGGIGMLMNEGLRATGFYEEDENIFDFYTSRRRAPGFQSELNYSSTDQIATVGEVPETIALRQQTTTIPAGASVKQLSSGPSNVNLTINLVTRQGETIETTNISTSLSQDEMNKAITSYLDSKLNLSRNR